MSSTARHTLAGRDYHSNDVYAVEQERIFFATWMYAGRVDQVAEPGQFFTVDIAGEGVIVTRSSEGGLRAFYNVCRHRGSVLCEEPRGQTKAVFQCPYHAWCYDLDGALVATPRVGKDEVERSELSLKPVHVDEWQGFVFVNLSRHQPEPLVPTLDAHYDSPLRFADFGLGVLRTGFRSESVVAANWKILVENYDECLHCPIVHPELVEAIPAYKKGMVFDPDRADGGVAIVTGGNTYSNDPRARRTLLPNMTEEQATSIYGAQVFPTMFLDIAGSNAVVTRLSPEGPRSTRVFSEYLFMPEEIESPDFDPKPVVDFCELVAHQDYVVSERVQKGVESRSFTHGVYPEKDEYVHQFNEYYRKVRGPLPD
ncbi:MAG: aromatic ring-hydroxylating dioxygenase subunit alpha [Actinomycetota bacterium]|nr:aromatic ring-hydroxylating dioxygenase subunit alpha [Actinomycetota bacterium]